jgi:hypothetical protein
MLMNTFFLFLKKKRYHISLLYFIGIVVAFFIDVKPVVAKEVILWERLKVEPEIALIESYSDNIYRRETDQKEDYITSVMPALDMQFAFTPNTRIEMLYVGLFNHYKNADNFKKDHHYGHSNLQMEADKGSSLEIGAWGEDSAEQPNNDVDTSKDYTIGSLYADANLKVLTATELFGTYQYSVRRFDDEIDRRDDYDRDFFALGLVNSHSTNFPLLMEYRYVKQENDEDIPEPTDFSYQSAFTGFRWREDQRLSGNLRVGYLWSDYNGSQAYNGWAADTDLTYRIGPFTTGVLSVERGVRESTRSARDTLDYYVYASGGLSLRYTRLDPIGIFVYGDYENRDYRSATLSTDQREDDLYIAGVTARYRFRDWLSFSLGYRYQMNDSSIDLQDYTENRVFAEIILFSAGEVRGRRLPRSVDQIRYF